MQDNLRRGGYLCCCQSIKLVDGKEKITGNTVKVDETCARLMFGFSDTKSLEVNKQVIKTASMISGVTEHIGLDNMRCSYSLEVVDSRRLSNLPTAQKTPHTRRLGRHIQHRILLEVGDSLAVADCWMQVVSTIPDGAKAGCSSHLQ